MWQQAKSILTPAVDDSPSCTGFCRSNDLEMYNLDAWPNGQTDVEEEALMCPYMIWLMRDFLHQRLSSTDRFDSCQTDPLDKLDAQCDGAT